MPKENTKVDEQKNVPEEKKILIRKISKSTVRSMHYRT